MAFPSLLDPRQTKIWQSEKQQIEKLLELVSAWEISPEDLEHLQRTLEQLHELFLLVVVGEFNSGKTAIINALLGQRYLKEGVTPTTDRIHIIRHGVEGPPEFAGDDVRVLRYPVDFLQEINIVDTPGTNAVLRRHEAISRHFVPRSDLVLFVTSADRPFTESERDFLEHIRQWGKKVVVLINKADILDDSQSKEEVESFVQDQV
ncbi:MAG: dynamin family protein, partial [Anaerolineales bacterium]